MTGSPADDYLEHRWLDEEAGPVVRPYAMTRGRTRPVSGRFDLISLVTAAGPAPAQEAGLGPEHQAIVEMCGGPLSVAEIAAHLDLPLGTVRVFLGDLLDRGHITVQEPSSAGMETDDSIFEAVINGLRAL